jgi:hypothetical protein
MSSKIPEATDKIKKKLSFNDVKPVYQQAVNITKQEEDLFPPSDEVNRDDLPVYQQNSKPANEHASLPLNHKESVTASHSIERLDEQPSSLVNQSTSIEVSHIDSECEPMTPIEVKKKATYYLTEKAHKLMDEMFIKSIVMGKKKDKSALACEAIELLYQKEIG